MININEYYVIEYELNINNESYGKIKSIGNVRKLHNEDVINGWDSEKDGYEDIIFESWIKKEDVNVICPLSECELLNEDEKLDGQISKKRIGQLFFELNTSLFKKDEKKKTLQP